MVSQVHVSNARSNWLEIVCFEFFSFCGLEISNLKKQTFWCGCEKKLLFFKKVTNIAIDIYRNRANQKVFWVVYVGFVFKCEFFSIITSKSAEESVNKVEFVAALSEFAEFEWI